MIYISKENPVKVTENSSLADRIRGNRPTFQCTEEMAKRTMDVFERSGCEKVTYLQYTKFAVINRPVASQREEMREVMEGYYNGEISKDDIKDFFMEYCSVMYARDEESVLNVYEDFLNENYFVAVQKCFAQGKDIAAKEGVSTDNMVYFDADYYYLSEEIHDLLKEAAKEYGAKYGIEVDAAKRDAGFKRDYVTGTPNFNDKWNFMATNMMSSGRLMDQNAVPPKDFSFFYKQGTDIGTKNSLLFIGGKDWSEKVDVPFKMPAGGKNTERYFYLSDLYKVSREKKVNYQEYNKFLNKLIVTRIWGDSPIVVEKRQ